MEAGKELVHELRNTCPRASWTRPESWHLTLRFLGEISETDAATFAAALEKAGIEAIPTGELRGAGPVLFPPRGRPRVLGIGVTVEAPLEALWKAGTSAARAIGLPPEGRGFHPHLTLARLRDPWPPSAVDAFRENVERRTFPAWRLESCVLFQSRLDPAGAVHTPLRTWMLARATEEVRP